ncbi:MAG: T9SS type A sorting domain-containing protein [Flavobacteriales bacterium]|nr:T9SS type A sorting domain-containing protein [Flavobacteriales bacterium]
MKSALFTLIMAFACCAAFGQAIQRQTTSAMGSSSVLEYNQMRLSILSSVGQASAIGYGRENKFHLRQGFIQPFGSNLIYSSTRSSDLEANVYPNPFRDAFQIAFAEPLSATITLFDLTGKALFRRAVQNADMVPVSASHIAQGTYILHIQSGSKTFKGMVIKI